MENKYSRRYGYSIPIIEVDDNADSEIDKLIAAQPQPNTVKMIRVDAIPVDAIKAARKAYATELKHTQGVLYSAFPKHKVGLQAVIDDLDSNLKEIDAWLNDLK